MPSLALTDPLWWVARWVARLLAGLTVLGALTVGSLSPFEAPQPGAAAEQAPVGASWACGCAPASTGAPGSPVVTVAAVTHPDVTVTHRATADSGVPTAAGPAAHGVAGEGSALAAPVAASVTVAATEAEPQRNAIRTVRAPRAPPGS
ncbi:hypothetical protein E1211_01890 [Micromonospora sp. 15K316]|uniref:hypothetical protein n=1 Tax=Micromonospora sp. 15K316 TaxID=2530376 RepID=UPI001053FEB6|nr:hypothetical protein [Micromonospora sp. 15K316]TDC40259.1 hypothetical protein E1211_01890 [Micromonospora sp. 15K316]